MKQKKGVHGWLHLAAIIISAVASAIAASKGVATPEMGAALGGGANALVATFCKSF